MAATVHIIARFRAKEGKEDALKAVLVALVPPTRREVGCYQYDLLQSPTEPQEFCIVERWDNEASLAQHTASEHLKKALAESKDLTDGPAEGRRYAIV
jgi:quinol monooxygenase YgiN